MDKTRDIHFQGFAKLLWNEFEALHSASWERDHFDPDEWAHTIQTLIAQRAYDLVKHASECIDDRQMEEGMRLTPQYMVQSVSDLTEWPTTEST